MTWTLALIFCAMLTIPSVYNGSVGQGTYKPYGLSCPQVAPSLYWQSFHIASYGTAGYDLTQATMKFASGLIIAVCPLRAFATHTHCLIKHGTQIPNPPIHLHIPEPAPGLMIAAQGAIAAGVCPLWAHATNSYPVRLRSFGFGFAGAWFWLAALGVPYAMSALGDVSVCCPPPPTHTHTHTHTPNPFSFSSVFAANSRI